MADNKDIVIIDEQMLKDKVYEIRGEKVLLDFDLAEIYGYTTKAFNQQVKNNIDKFDEDFRFQLTKEELDGISLRSKNLTLKSTSGNQRGMHFKYLPHAFTEQGIYMLMTVLRGDLAVAQSKTLIRLFKQMKEYITEINPSLHIDSYSLLAETVLSQERKIEEIKQQMVTKDELNEYTKLLNDAIDREQIMILNGQPLKADIAYQDIFSSAGESIILIDEYLGVKTLRHLAHSKKDVEIVVITGNKGAQRLRAQDYADFRSENPARKIKFIKSQGKVHDRYIILDYQSDAPQVFLSGTSAKDAGRRITTIVKLNDTEAYVNMVSKLLGNKPLKLK